ncbi:Phenol hydroxylase, FAD-and [2Fe-2S]-containing reductase component DmpP [Castellaniella defragrans 65Phen]|uniref:Phenol hydroxylase, FAD-and [2Fe-2S]-containing reductase component DmpP n=1 Tax=Castellaniella defragrans (strain DSM 12143 / CCUG 39792 / 65Phen) TaxID=1437824 RepID=W8X2Q9_CASD6|nr:2Fe-2S iron-sulfur cluster binding domain-containing protein [Castellaniella defragrans]CDM23341.1 Phenol hydroxylase, FAD-and [2Fe-2S]-containing reductase component DmpP [Castellaniella defragrans 65Phen]
MSYELKIEPLGAIVEVEEEQTILDAALRAGVWLPHACCHGLCATCKIQVVEGDIDHGESSSYALMDFEREEGKTLACCARLESDTTIEVDIDPDPDARLIPVRDHSGVVSQVVSLTPTIKAIHIELDDPIDFMAGQYINLRIDQGQFCRAFSLAQPPAQSRQVELNVRLVPGGEGTTWIHERLRPGMRVNFSGPYGQFFVRKKAQAPSLFIAGGSGLASPRSMILDLLAEDPDARITLVYGQRTREELYYHEDFLALAARHPGLTYVPVLSHEPETSTWTGCRGFVHDAARAHFQNDFRGWKAYLCGPPLMIEACISMLIQGRLYEKDIYTEKFISAADAQQLHSPLFKRL